MHDLKSHSRINIIKCARENWAQMRGHMFGDFSKLSQFFFGIRNFLRYWSFFWDQYIVNHYEFWFAFRIKDLLLTSSQKQRLHDENHKNYQKVLFWLPNYEEFGKSAKGKAFFMRTSLEKWTLPKQIQKISLIWE